MTIEQRVVVCSPSISTSCPLENLKKKEKKSQNVEEKKKKRLKNKVDVFSACVVNVPQSHGVEQ